MSFESSSNPPVTYVLDTSAIVAYLAQEAGGDRVKPVREAAGIPFISLAELYAVMWRKHGQVSADETLQSVLGWHVPVLIADERVSLSAGYLKARHSLGIADSYVAALALASKATLVTKDHDFLSLKPDLQILFLS